MRRLLAVVAVPILSGCIVQAPTESKTEVSNRLPPAPAAEIKSGANFADSVELTSVIVNPSRGVPGESVRVTASFKVMKEIPEDYTIFVHVEDVDGRVDRLNVDHTPVRGSMPTSKWKAGDVIRDDFDIPIPPNMPVRGLNVALGFWNPRTDQRLKIVNANVVKTDGRDRLYVASFPVAAQ